MAAARYSLHCIPTRERLHRVESCAAISTKPPVRSPERGMMCAHERLLRTSPSSRDSPRVSCPSVPPTLYDADLDCRITAKDCIGGYVTVDDGGRSDNRTVADLDIAGQHRASTDPHVFADAFYRGRRMG